ncbi:PfkB family carbohydrate kinase [Mesorhizobium sp.]|uniref:PfkB family carbohydrate kinase n=1 Tax=Mesorhizobium sp. TaxID=1871066 RepID=UPI000FE60D9F|nr:PfkB family carbohydrate kinase [Mesorhizobium sp.]RWD73866.1 MAG: fructoselysine 6-kinase [Mesorhizobium sp.]TIV59207.1 MAG: fructoselysine 6-kinase [Mesorhizobium sp.]
MTSAKLVAVGDNCLDVYLTRGLLTVGGNALNVAVQWRRNGWQARYFGAVGNDDEGDIVLDEVVAAGLSGDDVERRPGDTAVTLLRDKAGDRNFLLESFGVGEDYRPPATHYHSLTNADWVHLGTNANRELLLSLVADKIPFSVDVSTLHFALPLEGVPLLFASGPDDPAEPVEPLLAAFRKAGARKVVLTCGARGAYFDDGGRVLYQKAMPVEVVDTCGAGDSFIATFLASFCIERETAEEALCRATAAASLTCTHLGGFPQTPRPIPDWLPAKYAQYLAQEQEL